MKRFLEGLANVDRRILFLLVVVVILVPIMHPLALPGLKVTDSVRGVYDQIEKLPPRSTIAISFDFDPASKPELYPMALAVTRHAFKKDLKVIGMNLWITGTGLADEILTAAAAEHGKRYGEDYVFLGWQPSPIAVITGVFTDIYKIFSKDQKGNDTRALPVMKGFRSFQQLDYFVELGAGSPGLPHWVQYGADKFKIKMGGGCTAVSEPGYRPYYPVQITGLIPAMKGAAEYESLIGKPDKAYAGLDAISLGHFLILLALAMCNLIPVLTRFTK
ncbi:MAG: hypothetical protein HY927_14815 [Elusimicrobia bacterium]|nr:hypothetical protein [Elusimicrobiota bacterium]